jgi:1,4-alpha-glucan branching enzyme
MSIKKQYLKSKPFCKITFRVPSESASGAQSIHLVGEFNEWDIQATPLKKLKNGDFTVTVDLENGRAYQFRYLIDGRQWENDGEADKYIRTDFGDCENSCVII